MSRLAGLEAWPMEGAFIVDKPAGMTSHDVVARVRRAVRETRVGHTGTLDPFATGVLVICVGRATRLSRFLSGLDKTYHAVVRLGYATETQDFTGKRRTLLKPSNKVRFEEVQRVMKGMTGRQRQTPPMYSAKKVGGERLYRAARAGREVEREPVEVSVYSMEPARGEGMDVMNEDGTRDIAFTVHCSSGTYVRTLAHDMGSRLGVGGHLAALRRTGVGHFGIAQAIGLDDLEAMSRAGKADSVLVGPSEMLAHLPEVRFGREDLRRIKTGREVEVGGDWWTGGPEGDGERYLRLSDERGVLLGVGEWDFDRKVVKPRVVLESAS